MVWASKEPSMARSTALGECANQVRVDRQDKILNLEPTTLRKLF
jgi:hypothetical protein